MMINIISTDDNMRFTVLKFFLVRLSWGQDGTIDMVLRLLPNPTQITALLVRLNNHWKEIKLQATICGKYGNWLD